MRGSHIVRLVVLIIGLIVLLAGGALVISGMGPDFTETTSKSFSAASTNAIAVDGFNGRITFEPWDEDDIRIEATTRVAAFTQAMAERFAEEVDVQFAQDGGRVRVEAERRFGWLFRGNVGVSFVVRAPVDWIGAVELKTGNGVIDAEALPGDARLHTSNGRIAVDGHTGNLQARTSNGRVELRGSRGAVDVHTSNGAVRIMDAVLTGDGRVRTSNGAITFEAGLFDDAAYDVITSNGSVDVRLVEPDVALDFRTSNGGIDLRTDVNVSRIERTRLEGRIGTGRAHLHVRTSNGSISLGRID